MDAMLLDQTTWDLTLDASGNIAICTGAYALAQNAACACRLFLSELFLDVAQGVPSLPQILGAEVPLALVKAKLVAAALTVTGVASAEVFISSIEGRTLTGQIQITATDGAIAVATL